MTVTPTWPKTNPVTFALLATCLAMFAFAACSPGPPSAEEIIARTREAMGQLTSYQWTSSNNAVSDGRFGAPITIRTNNFSGSWRSDGRTELTWLGLGSDGQSPEAGFFRRHIQIGDQAVVEYPFNEVFVTNPGISGLDAQLPGLYEDDRVLARGPDSEMDGRRLFTLESITDEETGPRSEDPAGPVGHRSRMTTYFIDMERFFIVHRGEQNRTELPVLGIGGTELQSTLQSINTVYFAFNEPVDIEFPEGFDPAASP